MRYPVCVKCQVSMKPEKIGVYVQEMYEKNTKTYKIWNGDMMKCPICGVEVISAFADGPGREAHSCDIEAEVKKLQDAGRMVVQDNEVRYMK